MPPVGKLEMESVQKVIAIRRNIELQICII